MNEPSITKFLNYSSENLVSYIPTILGLISILIIGLFLSKFLCKKIIKLIKFPNFNTLCQCLGITGVLQKLHISETPMAILSKIIFWLSYSIVIVACLDILKLTTINQTISRIILYLPNLLTGLVLIILGFATSIQVPKILARKIKVKKFFELKKLLISAIKWGVLIIFCTIGVYQIGIAKELVAAIYITIIAVLGLLVFLSVGLASIAIMEKVMMKKLVFGIQKGESTYDLTDKQYELYKFLKDFLEKHNRVPFIREMQQAIGDKSTKSIAFKLVNLQEKGYIYREKGKHRSLKILK